MCIGDLLVDDEQHAGGLSGRTGGDDGPEQRVRADEQVPGEIHRITEPDLELLVDNVHIDRGASPPGPPYTLARVLRWTQDALSLSKGGVPSPRSAHVARSPALARVVPAPACVYCPGGFTPPAPLSPSLASFDGLRTP